MRFPSLAVWIAAAALSAHPLAVKAQDWATYRHPLGFSLRYPGEWRVEETFEGVAFVPGDAATDGMGQPLELFILSSDDAAGVRDPASPAVVAYFQQALPGFRQAGQPQRVDNPLGPAAILTFEGSLGGPPLRQRTYIVLREGKGIYLAHLATAELAPGRDEVGRRIFDSFTWGEASMDPAVVGVWVSQGGSVSEGYANDYASSGRTEEYRFGPDGTVRYTYESSISVDVDGMSAYSGGGDENYGTWVAGDGILYIRFQDGTEEEYRYERTTDGSGNPVLQLKGEDGRVLNFFPGG